MPDIVNFPYHVLPCTKEAESLETTLLRITYQQSSSKIESRIQDPHVRFRRERRRSQFSLTVGIEVTCRWHQMWVLLESSSSLPETHPLRSYGQER